MTTNRYALTSEAPLPWSDNGQTDFVDTGQGVDVLGFDRPGSGIDRHAGARGELPRRPNRPSP